MDVSAWLDQLGLGEYAASFAANHVDAATLRRLSGDDLREIGVLSVGHRRRLLEAIADLEQIPSAVPVPTPAAFLSERRPIAILFADLCGSTAMARDLADERLHAVLDGYLQAADAIVKRHGGTIDKHIGDAVMALFGVPLAHEDDMQRAVRAALELRAVMPKLSLQLHRDLAVHAGLAAGEVIVGASGSGWSVVGETVNLASRLTDLAPPGEIFVSNAVQRALADYALFESRGVHAVKGFDDPIEVWRLSELTDPGLSLSMTPFVGRATELAQITTMMDASRRTGAGGVVYVCGEPGIGKSRLIGEARAFAAQSGIACHVCHVLDFGAGNERDPLRRLAGSLLGLLPESPPDRRAAAIDAFVTDGAVEARLLPFLYELAEAPLTPALRSLIDASDNDNRRSSRHAALGLLVERAAARGPVLLVVEDLHWADAALVEALMPLTRLAIDRSLVLAMTSRPENEHMHQAMRSQRANAPLVSIDLGPLRSQDATMMVSRLSTLPPATVRQYVDRAGGNPLFLQELLRNAVEVVGDLPPSLRGLVLARVDRLAPADRAAIQAASVLGERFDPLALRALLGNATYDPAGLLRASLLRIDGSDLIFAHALIRDAVQRSLLAETQRALHGRAAEWFADRDSLLHAVHLEHAGSPKAANAFLIAAEDRLQRYRPAEALPLVECGLALATEAESRAALLVLKGDVLMDGGRMRDALGTYQEALQAEGSARHRCLALLGSASARRILEDLPPAFEELAAAQALAEAGDWLDLQARCHYTRGNLYYPTGRVDDCRAEHQRSVDLAERSDNAEAKARALGGLADVAYTTGRMLTSGHYARQCIEECRRIGLGRLEVANLPMVAFSLIFEMRAREAATLAHDCAALAAAVGQLRPEMVANLAEFYARLMLDEYEAARAARERFSAIARRLEAWRFEAQSLHILALLELRMGHKGPAWEHAAEGLKMARETGMSYYGPPMLAYAALLAEDETMRDRLVAETEASLTGNRLAHNHMGAREAFIELGNLRADPDYIEEQASKLEAVFVDEPLPRIDFSVRRGRVLAAALRGQPSRAMAAEAQVLLDWAERTGALGMVSGLQDARTRLEEQELSRLS